MPVGIIGLVVSVDQVDAGQQHRREVGMVEVDPRIDDRAPMVALTPRSGNLLVRDAVGARRLNRWQRPWFRRLPPKGHGVLTTTGRASGRPHELCVRAMRHGDTAYVTAIKGGRPDWVRNVQADARVALTIRGV